MRGRWAVRYTIPYSSSFRLSSFYFSPRHFSRFYTISKSLGRVCGFRLGSLERNFEFPAYRQVVLP